MKIILFGFDTQHDETFRYSRWEGLRFYSLLLFKTPAFLEFNENKILVRENYAILFDINTPHTFYPAISNYSDDFVHYEFDEDELKLLQNLSIPFDTPFFLSDMRSLSEIVKKICIEHYSKNPYKQRTVTLYTEILLNKLSEQISVTNENILPSNMENLSLLRSRIYTFPDNDWNAESISKELFMSKSHLHHSYKQMFDTTITSDIIQSRINHAKQLLIQTKLSVSEIAKMCGYKNDVHFMRQFKIHTKKTPSQYRSSSSL